MRMKELVSIFSRVSAWVKRSGNIRLLYYILVSVALLAAFLMLPEKEIAFIYYGY